MNRLILLSRLLEIYINYCLRKQYLNYYPIRIWVELSSRCNLKCRYCMNKDLPASQKGDMDFKLYKKIIDESAGKVYDINLFHRGEPLLNKNIISAISYANKKGIRTRIHTNATLLNKELDREIILAGLDLISFSFDGYTKEVYEKNRVGARFEETLSNIINFLRVKEEIKSKKPYTIIQVIQDDSDVDSGETVKQKRNFLKNFDNLPLDKFVIRTPHNWGGLLKINGKSTEENKKKKKNIVCTFPWYSLTIFYDGRVFLCPQDFEGRICLGNAENENIEDIFNGREIRNMRKRFSSGSIDDIIPCRDCDRIKRKTILGVPAEYLGAFIREHMGD